MRCVSLSAELPFDPSIGAIAKEDWFANWRDASYREILNYTKRVYKAMFPCRPWEELCDSSRAYLLEYLFDLTALMADRRASRSRSGDVKRNTFGEPVIVRFNRRVHGPTTDCRQAAIG